MIEGSAVHHHPIGNEIPEQGQAKKQRCQACDLVFRYIFHHFLHFADRIRSPLPRNFSEEAAQYAGPLPKLSCYNYKEFSFQRIT